MQGHNLSRIHLLKNKLAVHFQNEVNFHQLIHLTKV